MEISSPYSTDLVIPHLYIGPWESRTQVETLNIKHVISVLTDVERGYKIYPGNLPNNVTEHSYLVKDEIDFELKTVLADCLPKIHAAIQANENVLVHCAAGISRSASVIIAYLTQYHKMDIVDAIILLKNVRPSVSPNPSFIRQIYELEMKN